MAAGILRLNHWRSHRDLLPATLRFLLGKGVLGRIAAKTISGDAPEAGRAGRFGRAIDFGFSR